MLKVLVCVVQASGIFKISRWSEKKQNEKQNNMRKNILGFLFLLGSCIIQAQIGIGVPNPDSSAVLELSSTSKGFLPPRLTTAQRDAIISPDVGLMIFNTTKNCLEWYNGTVWYNACGILDVGSIATINCAGSTLTGSLTHGLAASGVSSSIPYTGSNGGSHTGQVVASTGVTGLTATLTAGNFAVGNGSLTYDITGTPTSSGTASFAVNIGGQSCTLSVAVAVGSIATINCAGSTLTGSLTHGVATSGVSSSIPYTGGNGGSHTDQVVASTGVTGLTATLSSGNFAVGTGSLTYDITGTPTSSGTASFAVNIGGQSCSLSVVVAAGSVAALDCAGSTPIGDLISGLAANVSTAISYTGGDGGSHAGQVVASTGVTGLTATLTAGSFAVGNGSLNYAITGTAASSGTALFAVNIGGQSCSLSIKVFVCGAKVASGSYYKGFSCHNLGADDSLDPHVPVQGIHGDYYQWGRSTVVADASTSAAAINGWNTTPAANGSWLDGSKTANDPCPAGFRVPTSLQWAGVIANNIVSRTGSWANDGNFTTAIHWGPDASTPTLTLPACGYRFSTNGTLFNRGVSGLYGSSTESGTISANFLLFNSSNAITSLSSRASGLSVRCVSE
jgi:uncharacterized protein (TIGR02145 family)